MSSAFGADEHGRASPSAWRPDGASGAGQEEEASRGQGDGRRPVFVPCAARPDENGHLRRTDLGELALPVFTSVETLVACCGEDQPWVAFRAGSLPDLVEATGATGIAQDVELPRSSGGDA